MVKGIDYYKDLASGGDRTIGLTQEEECVVLKIHDYGLTALSESELHLLYRVVGKLKDEIWP